MFAGLNADEINEVPLQSLQTALLAANADFGLGDFASAISGGDTAFDLLADVTDQGNGLGQDGSQALQQGVASFFQQNLFGN